MPVLHTFVNPIADEPGFLGTKPSDWNDTHSVSIENADVDAAAGIEESKLSLNFPTHAPVTLGVANGLSLSGQQLSMALAGANSTGTLSAQDWNTFNGKQSALSFPLVASLGGTSISNTGTFTNHSNTIVVGGGTLSLGGYTLTIPATMTGAGLEVANVFIATQQITVPTATQDGLTIKTSDNSETKRLFKILDSSNAEKFYIQPFAGAGGLFARLFGWLQVSRAVCDNFDDSNFNAWVQNTVVNSSNSSMVLGNASQNSMTFRTKNSAAPITFEGNTIALMSDAATNTITTTTTLTHVSTGTPAAGFGVGQSFIAETATVGTNQQQGLISTSWVDATNATRKAKMSLSAYDTAARLGIEIEASGTEAKLGFYGVATIARAVLATGVSATVDDVITALQNLGLVKQS